MEIIYIEKNFKKISNEEKKAIEKSVNRLANKIEQYKKIGTSFQHIFNDDSVKYSILQNDFCVFKHQNQQIPLRLLYRYKCNTDRLEIHLSYVKKYDDKRYFKMFRDYAASN